MQSMAKRLSVVMIPAMLSVLLLGGLMLYSIISRYLVSEFEEGLHTKARSVMALTEIEVSGFEMEHLEILAPEFMAKIQPDYLLISEHDGTSLVSQPTEDNWWPVQKHENAAEVRFGDVRLPDGREGYMISVLYLPLFDVEGEDRVTLSQQLEQKPLRLQVAISRAPLDKLLRSLKNVLYGVGGVFAVLTVVLIKLATTYAIKPLLLLSDQIETIDESSLSTRIGLDVNIVELNSLTTRFNHMLARLKLAFDREKNFSSDVSHELRTPLAELTTAAEVIKLWPDNPSSRENFVNDVISSTRRMTRVVESLLSLSRWEGDVFDLLCCDNLSAEIESTIEVFSGPIGRKNILVNWQSPGAVKTSGRDQWRLVLSNLVENSVNYSPVCTEIDISLAVVSENKLIFSISNDAPDLTEEDLEHLFERFWRKDSSRTSGEHSGIGLSLVQACVNQIDARATATLVGERLTIELIQEPTSLHLI